jgi:hypothetical protein
MNSPDGNRLKIFYYEFIVFISKYNFVAQGMIDFRLDLSYRHAHITVRISKAI